MGHPFLAAIYAAARRHLAEAREAEDKALEASLDVYRGGSLGREARQRRATWDQKRETSLMLALNCRDRAKRLRRELARLQGAA